VISLILAAMLAPQEPPAPRLRIDTDVSYTINLVHWVDNLAGSSGGKTIAVYRRYWEERFGPMNDADRAALEAFARIRNMSMPEEGGLENEAGCLPIEAERLSWHQRFLVEAMEAPSVDALLASLSDRLAPDERRRLGSSLERFRPRFDRVWGDMGHVRRFDKRFQRFLAQGDLLRFLDRLAGFFGVDPAAMPPMKISFVALPSDGATHAEADGDHLLIEIRPSDLPADQIQVVAHEASHFLMRRMGPDAIDALARQAYAEGEAGAIAWRYMWEGIPTALGQGLAEATLSPGGFSSSNRWYHIRSIDFLAKAIYEGLAASVRAGETIADGTITRLTRITRGTPLYSDARATDFLRPGFYASGTGMREAMDALRHRLGLTRSEAELGFDLADAEGVARMRRYTCVGGLVLVKPAELEAALAIDAEPLLAAPVAEQVRAGARRGASVIAAGNRAGGGRVYLLVAPDAEAAGRLADALGRLRGTPGAPIVIAGDAAAPADQGIRSTQRSLRLSIRSE